MTLWVWIWLGIIALAIILEAATMELVSIWCIFGGIVALVLALCGVSIEIQWIVFGAVSVILLLSLRKIMQKFLYKNDQHTNADAEFGKTTNLITSITKKKYGTIKVNGITWTATTVDGTEIEAGQTVKIINLEGNKYIVEKIEKEEIK